MLTSGKIHLMKGNVFLAFPKIFLRGRILILRANVMRIERDSTLICKLFA